MTLHRLIATPLFALLGALPFFALAKEPSAVPAQGVVTGTAKESSARRVRFLCAEFRTATRYQAGKNGQLYVLPFEFGDQPPARLILGAKEDSKNESGSGGSSSEKRADSGKGGSRLNWLSGRVTPEVKLTSEMIKGGSLVISVENAAAESAGKKEAPKPKLVPIATVPIHSSAKTQLVALYQPDLSAKWLPVKTLLLDISPEALPAGSCAVLNLSNLPAQVLLGEGGAPVALAPGASKVLPPPARDADGMVLTRAAVGTTEGPKILSNALRQMPKDGRHLVVIGSIAPSMGGGLPASLRVIRLD